VAQSRCLNMHAHVEVCRCTETKVLRTANKRNEQKSVLTESSDPVIHASLFMPQAELCKGAVSNYYTPSHSCVLFSHQKSLCSAKKKKLKGLLNEYKTFGGLSVHWIVVGPSGRETRPRTGGVLPYYKKCHTEVHPAVKTIANTWYLSGICVHPHNVQSRCVLQPGWRICCSVACGMLSPWCWAWGVVEILMPVDFFRIKIFYKRKGESRARSRIASGLHS
jgi:hypothetical protein